MPVVASEGELGAQTVAELPHAPGTPDGAPPVTASSPAARADLLDRMTLLVAVGGVPELARRLVRRAGGLAEALRRCAPSAPLRLRAARELERALDAGTCLAPGEEGWPAAALPDPPLLLFGRGTWRALAPGLPRVAIVGTREPDLYGAEVARRFAAALAEAGAVIVSGGARGVDATAHAAALDAGGRSVSVLASGLDHPSPLSVRPLLERLAASDGLVLTEVPPGFPARPHVFPDRNRLVAGLADAVLIIEAAERSGTLGTARHAGRLGRPVLAVPGDVCYRLSAGTNGLLSRGEALAATTPGDVLRALAATRELPELRWPPLARRAPDLPPGWSHRSPAPRPRPPLDPTQSAILEALAGGPLDVDALAARLGDPAGAVLAALGALELAGNVRRTDGAAWGIRGFAPRDRRI